MLVKAPGWKPARLVGEKTIKGELYYLVRWENYTLDEKIKTAYFKAEICTLITEAPKWVTLLKKWLKKRKATKIKPTNGKKKQKAGR